MAGMRGGIPQNPVQQAEKNKRTDETNSWDRKAYAVFAESELDKSGWEWVHHADMKEYARRKKQQELDAILNGEAGLASAAGEHSKKLAREGLYAKMPGKTSTMNVNISADGSYQVEKFPYLTRTKLAMKPWLLVSHKPWLAAKDEAMKFMKSELGLDKITITFPANGSWVDVGKVKRLLRLAEKNGMGAALDKDTEDYIRKNHPKEWIRIHETLQRLEKNRLQREILMNTSSDQNLNEMKTSLNEKEKIEALPGDTLDDKKQNLVDSLTKKAKTDEELFEVIEKDMNENIEARLKNLDAIQNRMEHAQAGFDDLLRKKTEVKVDGKVTGKEYGDVVSPDKLAKTLGTPPRIAHLKSFTTRVKEALHKRSQDLADPVKAVEEAERRFDKMKDGMQDLLDAKKQERNDLSERTAAWKDRLVETKAEAVQVKKDLESEKARLTGDPAATAEEKEKNDKEIGEASNKIEKIDNLLKKAKSIDEKLDKDEKASENTSKRNTDEIPRYLSKIKDKAGEPKQKQQHQHHNPAQRGGR